MAELMGYQSLNPLTQSLWQQFFSYQILLHFQFEQQNNRSFRDSIWKGWRLRFEFYRKLRENLKIRKGLWPTGENETHGEDEENETPSFSLKTDARKSCRQGRESELLVWFSGEGKVRGCHGWWFCWLLVAVHRGVHKEAVATMLGFIGA